MCGPVCSSIQSVRSVTGTLNTLKCLVAVAGDEPLGYVVDNVVRQLQPGEAFLIQAGRAVKLSVLQAPVPAQVQEEASALRAAALGAAGTNLADALNGVKLGKMMYDSRSTSERY